ncbi:ABC transporter permease [Paraglaciecola sp. MB-3u-78]|jgi:capsular polysaccharide transport system permease protein|uniref:ABC transporter permease n=1 Tax=Paraglaciecola sp. MB-3u-78 TaxID=2058332 RepID=UPI000C331891|nr:ABC transporter permease [Paraglaciecola sp. MB-3u-78]PKG98939.1 ABC transporter [Paraglaciecola sp. MB-3u-78]
MTTVIKRNKWEIWRDVIFALLAREIRTGFNDKFGIAWAVVQPVIFIFVLSFLRGRIGGDETHTIPTFTFMAIGLLFIQGFLQTMGASAKAISKNKALFAFRQVQPISAVLAGALFEVLVKIFVIIGIIILMYFMGIDLQISNPLLFLACFLLLWIFAVSLGLLFGIAELFVKEIGKVRELLTRPLFFISGVFFSLQDFPREYWHFLDWNPILHAIELTRYAVYSTYGSEGLSLEYLSGTVLAFSFFSLAVYHISWKQAISR